MNGERLALDGELNLDLVSVTSSIRASSTSLTAILMSSTRPIVKPASPRSRWQPTAAHVTVTDQVAGV